MSKDDSHPPLSWLERLIHFIHPEPQNRQQLIELLDDAKQRKLIDTQAFSMIEGVMQVTDMQVRDVMLPKPQMIVLEHDMTVEAALPIIIESHHSRFPIVDSNDDKVVGILLAKDLLEILATKKQTTQLIKDLSHPAIFIPESKRLNILLNEFRINHNHIAIVVNEYGNTAGLITIEDVLEQIVGSIEDEYDASNESEYIRVAGDQEFLVNALTPINEFNQYFDTQLTDSTTDTIGGYIMQQFGYLPKSGESITIPPFKVTITQANRRSIRLVTFKKL